jgi:hypothetical protein
VTDVSCGDKRFLISEVGNHCGENFWGEAVGDGIVVVCHSAKHGDCDIQISLRGPNLHANDCQAPRVSTFSVGWH